MFVEIAGMKIDTPEDFTRFFSEILNRQFMKGPIEGRDGEMVAGLFAKHPERQSKINGCYILHFISDKKDKKYQVNPTFRVVLSDGSSPSFGISTVRDHLRK